MEQLQSHKWLSASSYMAKYLRISSYIRKPFSSYLTLQLLLIYRVKFSFLFISEKLRGRILYVIYSTRLHPPPPSLPLGFRCVGGCWNWMDWLTQGCCNVLLWVRRSNYSARSHSHLMWMRTAKAKDSFLATYCTVSPFSSGFKFIFELYILVYGYTSLCSEELKSLILECKIGLINV